MVHETSEWPEVLQSLNRHYTRNGQISEFNKLKNDNIARIKFLLDDIDLKSILLQWMKYRLKRDVSLTAAKSLRESGNRKFSSKDFYSCIETYTESILSCPADCEEKSLATANRSAALFHLELFEDCLSDIEKAIENGYPENLLPKLLLRKVKVLRKLNLSEDSILEDLKLSMENMSLIDKSKMKTEIEDLVNIGFFEEEQLEPLDLPEPFNGHNPGFRGASASLDVKYTPHQGRFVISNRDIKAGETLFVEEPSALVVLPDFQSSRCHHCTRLFASKRFPCLQCGKTWFCSANCRQQATNYHQFECGLESVLNSVGIAHLGLRIVLVHGVQTVASYLNTAGNQLPGVGSPYDTNSYPVVYHLVSHTESLASEELFQYALTAAALTILLEENTDFFGYDKEEKYSIGAAVLLHVCQMVCNAHAITELCALDDSTERQERVATAIYPSASLMNHSCDPSVINSFQGDKLIVRAIKDIKAGDEVFNCYGPHYRRMSRLERLEALKAQYHFECQCPSCLDSNTEDFQDVIYSFQCQSCRGSLIKSQNNQTTCRSCKKPQSYFNQLQADLEAVALDAKGTEAMENGDVVQAIKLFEKCVQLRSRALYKAHPDLGRTADKLAHCYSFMGRYAECEKYLRVSLTAVEERYGRYSIEMGNELQKFTDVLLELASQRNEVSKEELIGLLDEVLLIFQIHYGSWSASYKEALEKKNRLFQW